MKFKIIKWNQHKDFENINQGLIGKQEVFTIESIKDEKFQLKSWSLKSDVFFTATSEKFLGEFENLSLAQKIAEEKWEEYTNGLLHDEDECGCNDDCPCKE